MDQHRLHKTETVYNIREHECGRLMTACVNNSPESADAVNTAAPDQHMTTTQKNKHTSQEGERGKKEKKQSLIHQNQLQNKNLSASGMLEQLV